MRKLIKMTLKGVAEVVGECADGAEALDCYEASQPDWVLMDWEMKTDGLTATRRIIKAHPQARILIVTNHDDDKLRTAASEAGARFYFEGRFARARCISGKALKAQASVQRKQ